MLRDKARILVVLSLLILVSVISGASQSIVPNSLRVKYHVRTNISFLDSVLNQSIAPNAPKELADMLPGYIEALQEASPIDIYYLEYKLGISKYYYDTTTLITTFKWNLAVTGSSTIVYKNVDRMEILQVDPIQSEVTAYESHFPMNSDWKTLENRDTSILGYTCLYAEWIKEPRENIHVWYTPSIELAEGPSTFSGLPGLILQVTTPTAVYLAREISLNVIQEEIRIPEFDIIIDGKN